MNAQTATIIDLQAPLKRTLNKKSPKSTTEKFNYRIRIRASKGIYPSQVCRIEVVFSGYLNRYLEETALAEAIEPDDYDNLHHRSFALDNARHIKGQAFALLEGLQLAGAIRYEENQRLSILFSEQAELPFA